MIGQSGGERSTERSDTILGDHACASLMQGCQDLRRCLTAYLRWLEHGRVVAYTTDYRSAGLTISDLHPLGTGMVNGREGSDDDSDDDGPPPLEPITPEAD